MGETVSINSLTSHSGRWRFCREGIPILRFSETVTLSLHFQKNFYKDFRSCILRASMKSPNSITAFLGPSFLTVSELFRFSSFQRKLAAPWLAAMFGTLDQPFMGCSSGFLCMCAGRPTARPFSRVRPACALESASKNQYQVI